MRKNRTKLAAVYMAALYPIMDLQLCTPEHILTAMVKENKLPGVLVKKMMVKPDPKWFKPTTWAVT